ncbi:septum formation initiator family protein [Rhodococcus sp. BS-15]|uniref:FtsB family cell division protein n=1 Tax=Rhodococcus sp. BS-15 TaxID=1304954 RepID=UPI001F020512|nr:cell division protein FtsL [Rhodococcus sp. BS-15]
MDVIPDPVAVPPLRVGPRPGGVSRDENASGRQATPPEPSEQVRDAVVGGKAAPRRVGVRRPKMPERTFFGLSTGRAVVLGVVVCALALTLAVPLRTYFSQRSELESVLAERQALEDDVSRLQVQKSQLDEPSRIAADARERLRFVMPGETPYQVQLPGDYSPSSEDLAVDTTPTGPWFTELWNTAVQPQGSDEPRSRRPHRCLLYSQNPHRLRRRCQHQKEDPSGEFLGSLAGRSRCGRIAART